MIFSFNELFSYRELMKNLVYRDLKIKYKESILGILWSFLNPLLMLIIYTLAFQFIIKLRVENFPLFFIIALLPWNFLVASMAMSVTVIVQNFHLIQKVYFPREILIISIIVSNLIQYLITLVILIPAMIYFKIPLSEKIIMMPLLIIMQALFITGICYILSVLYVFYRDMSHIVDVIIIVWFWLSPIVYPLEMIGDNRNIMFLYMLNPMSVFITSYRNIIMYDAWPTFGMLLRLLSAAVITFFAGRYIFLKYEKRFAELA